MGTEGYLPVFFKEYRIFGTPRIQAPVYSLHVGTFLIYFLSSSDIYQNHFSPEIFFREQKLLLAGKAIMMSVTPRQMHSTIFYFNFQVV